MTQKTAESPGENPPPGHVTAAIAAATAALARGRRLGDLAHEIPGARLVDEATAGVLVTGVRHDSRAVEPGDLFVARAGAKAHGASFLADAVARGASAVLVERASEAAPGVAPSVPRIEADDVPRALAYASSAVYGHPTFRLEVVGITGTNGKTTTAHLVQAAIDGSGGRAGIVGTLGYRFADLDLPATHTSPEADDLARAAVAMRARGATHLVMEASSIALAARRLDAVRFRVAAFTNLTQDHLDYHGTMEAYGEAKARLFTDLGPGAAALSVDDPFGVELARRLAPPGQARPRLPLVRWSASPGAPLELAEVAPVELSLSRQGIAMRVRTPGGELSVRSPLLGGHNVSNLLGALAVAFLLELDLTRAAAALSQPVAVPGRLERCDDPEADDVAVLVDYAHTPDALARVLDSVRALGAGRVICVFGCGGDRDPGKRALMGEAVGRRADLALVTSDNPRGEDPAAIVAAILPGLTRAGGRHEVELDRRRAIRKAILEARPGDQVLLAGKGHEPYQLVGDATLPFDDRDEARAALAARRARGG